MTTAVIVDAIRTPLGRRNGRLKDWHPVDLAAETLKALVDRTGIDPVAGRRRGHGLRHAGRRAGSQHRSQRRARRRLARHRARHHDRPPVRFVAAGRPLRRPGRDRRRLRRRRRRRCRGDDARADGRFVHGRQVRLPVRPDDGRSLQGRRWPRPAGHLRRADRRQVGHQPRRHGRVRRAQPAVRRASHQGGSLRARDPAGRSTPTARR